MYQFVQHEFVRKYKQVLSGTPIIVELAVLSVFFLPVH